MDASDGANTNGNGHADPSPVSLPSAVAPPAGGPVAPASPASETEPLVVVDRDPDGKVKPGSHLSPKTQIKKGQKLNPLGIQAHNKELWAAVRRLSIEDQKGKTHQGMDALLRIALKDPDGLKLIIEKLFADATPTAEAMKISIEQNASAAATAASTSTTPADDRLEELRDPRVRGAFGDLLDRIAERRGVASSPRGVGN